MKRSKGKNLQERRVNSWNAASLMCVKQVEPESRGSEASRT
jgi:hypothetical protein